MRFLVFLLLLPLTIVAQPQNPSPMVEHTRTHPRISQVLVAGQRENLQVGVLFLPEGLKKDAPLLVFFHGGSWLPQLAAGQNDMAVVTVQTTAMGVVYGKLFEDPKRFLALVDEAEKKAGRSFTRILVGGWSAGCSAIREILKSPEAYEKIDSVLLIDGIHTDYTNGKPGPQESPLVADKLQIWLQLGRDAIAGKKGAIITHSEVFPGTFASTTETADYIVWQLRVKRTPVLQWGPMGTQQLSEVRTGRFLLIGYAGNSAPDHVDQLYSLSEYLKWM